MKLRFNIDSTAHNLLFVGPVLFTLILAILLAGCSGADRAAQEGGLVIAISDVTETPSFYPVTVGKTEMEIIAVKASDGTIRTAFNTCQICYSSGRGYYELSGNELVCQNCGNRFSANQLEVESGGCNPWPIFGKDKTVTDSMVTIPQEILKSSVKIFANWK
ncbi:MAG TPA: DUF2318 domain-containing protein [Clostridia bacterium]|nr:DUF2318 domain-containing protein [Clostridia bacterium]